LEAQWKNVSAQADDLNNDFKNIDGAIGDNQRNVGDYKEQIKDAFSEITVGFSQITNGDFSGGLDTIKSSVAGVTANAKQMALAFLTNPLGIILAVVAGVGLGVKAIFDYNNQIKENVRLVENTFNNLGDKTTKQLDVIRNNISGISKTFDIEFSQIAETVDKLLDTGAVKTEMEALEVIKNGLLTAPNQDEFLSNLESAAEKSKQTGLNIQEIINLNRALEDSPVDADAVYGALDKATKTLTEQSDKTREGLSDALGSSFSNDLLARIDSGKITVTQALNEIDVQAKKSGLSISESANLGATLFGKSAVAAGGLANVLNLVTQAVDRQTTAYTPLQKATLDLVDANIELEIAKDKALKSDSVILFQKNLELFWVKSQTIFFGFIDTISDVAKWIDNVTGYSETLSQTWDAVKGYATQLWETISQVVDVFTDLYESLGLNDSKSGAFIKTLFQFFNPLTVLKNGFRILTSVIDYLGDIIETNRIRFSAFGNTAVITMSKLANAFKNFDFAQPLESLKRFADINISETYNKQFEAEKKAFDQRKKLRADQKLADQKAEDEEIARNKKAEDREKKPEAPKQERLKVAKKETAKVDDKQKALETEAKKEIELAKEKASQSIAIAKSELAEYISLNAEKYKDDKTLLSKKLEDQKAYFDEVARLKSIELQK
jgi:hypothetical protein